MAKHPERFFTYWALAAHGLYALGVLPSTFLLSILVLVGSIFHNCTSNKEYNFKIDMVHHVLPVLVFCVLFYTRLVQFKVSVAEFVLPFVMLAVYFASVGGIDRCLQYYSDHPYYFHND